MLATENRVNMRMSGLFIFNILCYILDMSNVSVTNIPQLAVFFLESNIIIKFSFASTLNSILQGEGGVRIIWKPFCAA
jgi:hypothetical protein